MCVKNFFKKFYDRYIDYKICSLCKQKVRKERFQIEEDYYCEFCYRSTIFYEMRTITMFSVSDLVASDSVFIGIWVENGDICGTSLYMDHKKGLCKTNGVPYGNAEKVLYCISLPRFIRCQVKKRKD